jgi:hypothetical protein
MKLHGGLPRKRRKKLPNEFSKQKKRLEHGRGAEQELNADAIADGNSR